VSFIMRTFRCTCGARIFFENTRCLSCGRELGFLPDALTMLPLEAKTPGEFLTPGGAYRKCANYAEHGVCNWMVPVPVPMPLPIPPPSASSNVLCQACQLNHVIPDLSQPQNRALWGEVEKGKRRLVYTLNRLKLPLRSKHDDLEHGLAFDIKADTGSNRVLTGHEDGLITLNLAEADPAEREKMRVAMKERYRTMLGHFRHEIGHYYWDRLVRDAGHVARFREVFGDESIPYGEALKRHYSAPPAAEYAESFISAYAAAHPWEDFAETFAHYLHMQDTLETAQDFGLASDLDMRVSVPDVDDFELLMKQWTHLTVALNALNRSMGLPDAYPFAISPRVKNKIEFVHGLVIDSGRSDRPAVASGP
jgi:hypothetical protein